MVIQTLPLFRKEINATADRLTQAYAERASDAANARPRLSAGEFALFVEAIRAGANGESSAGPPLDPDQLGEAVRWVLRITADWHRTNLTAACAWELLVMPLTA